MELEFVEVVGDAVVVGVDGSVVSQAATERLVRVVCADDDRLRQPDHALTQELISSVQRYDQPRHYQPVITHPVTRLLLIITYSHRRSL